MKKEYELVAHRKWWGLKQTLEPKSGDWYHTISVILSDDLGLKKGDKVKITIETIEKAPESTPEVQQTPITATPTPA